MALLRFVSIAIVLTLAGCGSSDNVGAGNPPIQVEDPYAVPTVIDDAYIELVMNRMEDTKHEATVDLIQNRQLTAFGRERLEAIYSGDALEAEKVVKLEQLDGLTAANVRPVRHYVRTIFSSSPTCIWFDSDLEAVLPGEYAGDQIVLRRLPHNMELNPTPWSQVAIVRLPAPSLDNPCG